MTVAELIEELKEMPQDAKVRISWRDIDCDCDGCSLSEDGTEVHIL